VSYIRSLIKRRSQPSPYDWLITILFLVPVESLPNESCEAPEILVHDIGGYDSVHKGVVLLNHRQFVDAATKVDKAFTQANSARSTEFSAGNTLSL
jgi:hypothetical protein